MRNIVISIFMILVILFSFDLTYAGDIGDINGDGKIGLEEAIHALQVVAGIKTSISDVSGYWAAYFTPQGSSTLPPEEYLQFTQNGSSISLSSSPCRDSTQINGTVSGSSLSITATGVNISGTVNGNNITGNYTDETGTGTWTATKLSGAPTYKQCVAARVDVILVRFQPGTNYCIESFIDDPTPIVISASLVGMGNTQGYIYDSVKKRWVDTGTRYCTSSPTFPMNYTVTVNFNDTTSSIVSRSVTLKFNSCEKYISRY